MSTAHLRRTARVLVIDDEQRLRDMLVRTAQELGFEAAGARSAEPAAKLIEQGQADIVLLDLNLPGMDGIELLRRIRQQERMIPVIILTGFGTLEMAKQAIRLDAVDFLTKPCAMDELEAALARARRRWLATATGPAPAQSDLGRNAPTQTPDEPALTLEDLGRIHILAALERNGGNRAATATELGISERTLYYRISQYQRDGYLS